MLTTKQKRFIRRKLNDEKFMEGFSSGIFAAKVIIKMIRLMKKIKRSVQRGEVGHDESMSTVLYIRRHLAEHGIEATPQQTLEAIQAENHCRQLFEER